MAVTHNLFAGGGFALMMMLLSDQDGRCQRLEWLRKFLKTTRSLPHQSTLPSQMISLQRALPLDSILPTAELLSKLVIPFKPCHCFII